MTNIVQFIERTTSKAVLEHLQQRAKESGHSLADWAARRIASKASLDAQVELLEQLINAAIADAEGTETNAKKRKKKKPKIAEKQKATVDKPSDSVDGDATPEPKAETKNNE